MKIFYQIFSLRPNIFKPSLKLSFLKYFSKSVVSPNKTISLREYNLYLNVIKLGAIILELINSLFLGGNVLISEIKNVSRLFL